MFIYITTFQNKVLCENCSKKWSDQEHFQYRLPMGRLTSKFLSKHLKNLEHKKHKTDKRATSCYIRPRNLNTSLWYKWSSIQLLCSFKLPREGYYSLQCTFLAVRSSLFAISFLYQLHSRHTKRILTLLKRKITDFSVTRFLESVLCQNRVIIIANCIE